MHKLFLLTIAFLLCFSSKIIGAPTNWELGTFARAEKANPIITPDPNTTFHDPILNTDVFWEIGAAFNPGAIVRNGSVFLFYRAEDGSNKNIGAYTSRLGLAESTDGIHFTRNNSPIFYPENDSQKADEWPGGCEDPRIVEREDGTYVMTYTQYNRKIAVLAVASSPDLVNWTKHGYAFENATGAKGIGKFGRKWSKSGSIICSVVNDRLIATKINGKYWMYWGDSQINIATSDDLISWQPLLSSSGSLIPLIKKRTKKFDSVLAEAGPPAVLTNIGIILIYNGKNGTSSKTADKNIGYGAYSAGQVLIDPTNPARVLARTDSPFIKPERNFEKSGQYSSGTVFVQGLVLFKGKWYIYYGAADATVGVATTNWGLGPFVRADDANPIITPNPNTQFLDPILNRQVFWEIGAAFNPGAIVHNDSVSVIYRAEDGTNKSIGGYTSRLGLGESSDGIHFARSSTPTLYPNNDAQKANEWPGGCEDPRIVEREDGIYVMTYTQWNRKIAVLAVATSPDLINWTKYGYAFANAKGANNSGSFGRKWSKSGSIVCQVVNGRLIAAKVNGKYWMYWGDNQINIATSNDLISWQPLLNSSGSLIPLISKRSKKFDSVLTEPGPPAVITDNGIVLIYNGKNGSSSSSADNGVGYGAYSAGQVLIDDTNPTKVWARSDNPFLKPEKAFEKKGQYSSGTVFTQGLVLFNGKWFLYYGAADATVGVASTF